ncbi:hypothetical protein AX16_005236 [Volvariella volvacea WC 439]|nr:hypothetical protein AX16_005236 [Volvariella volvacea WC 439]
MHAISATLHRAPPAARPRVRWQPYASSAFSTTTLSTPVSPSNSLPKSPSTSVTSPPPTSSSKSDLDRPRPTHNILVSTLTPAKDSLRENPKTKVALCLVEQTVRSLCDIWRPQDIPAPFATPFPLAQQEIGGNASQLPTPPITPSTSLTSVAAQCAKQVHQLPLGFKTDTNMIAAQHNLLKGFVHEVLRRSRTSGCVLQAALCYLEAVRTKIPKASEQCSDDQGHQQAIHEARPSPCEQDLSESSSKQGIDNDDSTIPTVRISDSDAIPGTCDSFQDPVMISPSTSSESLSPLLCPRRTFLASLILASKFMQDKCYSNRAWAKLSGLPPREISRCERALGEALEWRLWVGKPVAIMTSPSTIQRPVARSQSAGSLTSQPLARTSPVPSMLPQGIPSQGLVAPLGRGLRRAHTQPVGQLCTPLPAVVSQDGLDRHHVFVPEVAPSIMEHPPAAVPAPTLCPPSPPTPGLSYSPTSTASSSGSSGELTVQMTSFLDDSVSLSQDIGQWPDGPDMGNVGIPVCVGLEATKVVSLAVPQLEVDISPSTW